MSLSPIFSINSDFLVVISAAGSEFAGSRLRDMCRDVGSTVLLSGLVAFLLLIRVDPFSFFTMGRVVDKAVLDNEGFDDLGVDSIDDFSIDDGVDPFSFFTEGWVVDMEVLDKAGLDDLGVDSIGDLGIGDDFLAMGDAGFFLAFIVLVVFLTSVS